MKSSVLIGVVLIAAFAQLAAACGGGEGEATPERTPTVGSTVTPTATATKSPTAAATPELSPTATAEPTSKPTPRVGSTVTPTATATKSPTAAATPKLSPTATAKPTSTPTPLPEAPNAAPILVGPGIDELGEGTLQPPLSPDGVLNLDPVQLAEGLGITPPACAEFVLYLSWQVRQPYPPDDIDLEFYWTRTGGTELLAKGPSGQVSSGCGSIQVVNNSASQVKVEIRYVVGETSP